MGQHSTKDITDLFLQIDFRCVILLYDILYIFSESVQSTFALKSTVQYLKLFTWNDKHFTPSWHTGIGVMAC